MGTLKGVARQRIALRLPAVAQGDVNAHARGDLAEPISLTEGTEAEVMGPEP